MQEFSLLREALEAHVAVDTKQKSAIVSCVLWSISSSTRERYKWRIWWLQAVKEKVLIAFAALLGLAKTDPHHLLHTSVPTFRRSEHAVSIGRVSLSREASAARVTRVIEVASGRSTAFAHTGHTLRLMHAVAAGVARNECMLLVGESGTGKSALIQHLADQVRPPPPFFSLSCGLSDAPECACALKQ
jgi:midasin (ATPase involved in ribosome maturation)